MSYLYCYVDGVLIKAAFGKVHTIVHRRCALNVKFKKIAMLIEVCFD